MTKKEKLINKLLNLNLELCSNDGEINDGILHDLLLYGFKGFENMTDAELAIELKHVA